MVMGMETKYAAVYERWTKGNGEICDAFRAQNWTEAKRLCEGHAINGDALRLCREQLGLAHDDAAMDADMAERMAAAKAARNARFNRR